MAFASTSTSTSKEPRMRIRELLPTLHLGDYKPGPLNSLTDVPGVKAHTQEIINPANGVYTGVTSILPREDWFRSACYAGLFSFNGSGEMTGSHWLNETGLLHSPVVLTNSLSVGAAYEGIYRYTVERQPGDVDWFLLPVVGETFDGFLNDVAAFAVKPEHAVESLKAVSSDAVREGCTGGGAGMICHYFKGGTGSSSRVVPGLDASGAPRDYTIAALVQANNGKKAHFRIGGAPVGRILAEEAAKAQETDAAAAAAQKELEDEKNRKDGSIIVILATDAPLHPTQLQRIARRATVGLARVGGQGHNPSGDIFLAFSTGNSIPVQTLSSVRREVDPYKPSPLEVQVVDDTSINGLFEAAGDCVEESIYNTLCMAEDTIGQKGRRIDALPLGRVKEIMEKYL